MDSTHGVNCLRQTRFVGTLFGLFGLFCWQQPAAFGYVIDTRPPITFLRYFDFTGPDAAGGTFPAADRQLESFTLELDGLGSGTFQAIVLGTDGGGTPVLPILWQSGHINVPSTATEFTFSPGIVLNPGDLYFIGADFGSMTTATGSPDSQIGVAEGALLPVGSYWHIENGLGPPNETTPFYDIASRIVMVPTSCDFNGDGACNTNDVDTLIMEIAAMTNDPSFDLNGDSFVDLADRDVWLAGAGALNLPSGNPYLVADFDLDGIVDGLDFIEWNANKFSITGQWSLGDANADGITDGLDFIEWNTNKFVSSDDVAAVPEPSIGVLLIVALISLAIARQRRPAESYCRPGLDHQEYNH
jgi:hypothetical protein